MSGMRGNHAQGEMHCPKTAVVGTCGKAENYSTRGNSRGFTKGVGKWAPVTALWWEGRMQHVQSGRIATEWPGKAWLKSALMKRGRSIGYCKRGSLPSTRGSSEREERARCSPLAAAAHSARRQPPAPRRQRSRCWLAGCTWAGSSALACLQVLAKRLALAAVGQHVGHGC